MKMENLSLPQLQTTTYGVKKHDTYLAPVKVKVKYIHCAEFFHNLAHLTYKRRKSGHNLDEVINAMEQ
jgi:hypothetical protein